MGFLAFGEEGEGGEVDYCVGVMCAVVVEGLLHEGLDGGVGAGEPGLVDGEEFGAGG